MDERVENKKQNTETKPKNVLLGSISYDKDEDLEEFLNSLDVNQSVFVLITAVKYCQAKGAFTLGESELIAKAIKSITKSSKTE